MYGKVNHVPVSPFPFPLTLSLHGLRPGHAAVVHELIHAGAILNARMSPPKRETPLDLVLTSFRRRLTRIDADEKQENDLQNADIEARFTVLL